MMGFAKWAAWHWQHAVHELHHELLLAGGRLQVGLEHPCGLLTGASCMAGGQLQAHRAQRGPGRVHGWSLEWGAQRVFRRRHYPGPQRYRVWAPHGEQHFQHAACVSLKAPCRHPDPACQPKLGHLLKNWWPQKQAACVAQTAGTARLGMMQPAPAGVRRQAGPQQPVPRPRQHRPRRRAGPQRRRLLRGQGRLRQVRGRWRAGHGVLSTHTQTPPKLRRCRSAYCTPAGQ